MFWTIYQKLVTQQQVSEGISLLLLLRQYKRSVSKASKRIFGLSTVVLFASNDSKTFFEQWKNARWTDNWDDSLKTNIWPQRTIFWPQQSNFVGSNDRFVGDMGHWRQASLHLWHWGKLAILFYSTFKSTFFTDPWHLWCSCCQTPDISFFWGYYITSPIMAKKVI
jgi:hypothetical protein